MFVRHTVYKKLRSLEDFLEEAEEQLALNDSTIISKLFFKNVGKRSIILNAIAHWIDMTNLIPKAALIEAVSSYKHAEILTKVIETPLV